MRKFLFLAFVLLIAACTKDGDTIYKPDPNEEAASTTPLVTVIYDANALGDHSYNDLIYEGVERAAQDLGLRTLQLSPQTTEEGLQYLELMFRQMETAQDTVRRLFIVTSPSYDDFIRKNNKPLEGKGSTLFLTYYGAMYEGGRIAAAEERISVMLLGANRKTPSVTDALQGFSDGFEAGLKLLTTEQAGKNHLASAYLDERGEGGFSVADSTAMRLLRQWNAADIYMLVPVCGGASNTFARLNSSTQGNMDIVGIDVFYDSYYSPYSIVKHIDRALLQSIRQWFANGTMPKHQKLGLKEGYTEVTLNPNSDIYIWAPPGYEGETTPCLTEEMKKEMHEEAVRKEEEHEGN